MHGPPRFAKAIWQPTQEADGNRPIPAGDDTTKPCSIWEPLIVSFEDCISLFFIPFPCYSDVEKTERGAPATTVSTRFRGVLWPWSLGTLPCRISHCRPKSLVSDFR